MAQTVTIKGNKFELDALSDKAKALITRISQAEGEIARMKQRIELLGIARVALYGSLESELPASEVKKAASVKSKTTTTASAGKKNKAVAKLTSKA